MKAALCKTDKKISLTCGYVQNMER